MASASVAAAAVVALMLSVAGAPVSADGPTAADVAWMRTFMRELRAESRVDAKRIEDAYRDALDRVPADRLALASSWRSGRIAALPRGSRYNLLPRLGGSHPIGEKDLRHQRLYVGAEPAALGLLLHVASRVRSGPLEITSLVRHARYQRDLLRTNPNARTEVPTHGIGVAFDVSILYASRATARELRDVLRQMRDAGDLFFVAESQQLVFHIVVPPARASFYRAMFEGQMLAPMPWFAAPRRVPTPRSLDQVLAPIVARQATMSATVAAGAWPAVPLGLGMLVAFRRLRRRSRAERAPLLNRQSPRRGDCAPCSAPSTPS